MTPVVQDFESFASFLHNPEDIRNRLKENDTPVVLAFDGQPEIVLCSMQHFQNLMARLDQLETHDGIRKGLQDTKAGRGRPVGEVFEEIRP